MEQQGVTTKEISFMGNAADITVKANGASVEIHADGSILVHTSATVKVCLIVNDDGTAATPKIGTAMPDKTIYAGVSPDTGKAMYATPSDASLTMTFNEAQKYAAQLDAYGYQDWRVPTKNELNVLFNNLTSIGGFNLTGSYPAGWYLSASEGNGWDAWSQRFRDGSRRNFAQNYLQSVRCVR